MHGTACGRWRCSSARVPPPTSAPPATPPSPSSATSRPSADRGAPAAEGRSSAPLLIQNNALRNHILTLSVAEKREIERRRRAHRGLPTAAGGASGDGERDDAGGQGGRGRG